MRYEDRTMNWVRCVRLLLACLMTSSLPLVSSAEDASPSERLGRQMGQFVAGLDEDQQGDARYAFDDDERFDLRLAPLGLEGLRIDQMSDTQWTALESLLSDVLSPLGLDKVNTIRSLEREVAETEGGLFGFAMQWIRNPKRYFLAVFGDPGPEAPWGMRFDGHHLSLNWTAIPSNPLSVTPLFLGGQPRAVPEELARAGLRVLSEEEDRAMLLINELSEGDRAAARIPFGGGSAFSRPMSITEGERIAPLPPVGQAVRLMNPESTARLNDIIEMVLENFAPEVAGPYRARLATETEATYFGYAIPDEYIGASLRPGTPLYYRIQSASFLIEYDNSSEEADHIHLVWRAFDGDFGRDVLAEHLSNAH